MQASAGLTATPVTHLFSILTRHQSYDVTSSFASMSLCPLIMTNMFRIVPGCPTDGFKRIVCCGSPRFFINHTPHSLSPQPPYTRLEGGVHPVTGIPNPPLTPTGGINALQWATVVLNMKHCKHSSNQVERSCHDMCHTFKNVDKYTNLASVFHQLAERAG